MLSIRRLRSSFRSRAPFFVVTRPRTTNLPGGTNRSGSNPPDRVSSSSRKNIDVQLVEERFGDVLVAARRHPLT